MGDPGFESRKRQEIFVFSETCRPSMGSTLPPIQFETDPFPEENQSGREDDHSTPNSNPRLRISGPTPLFPYTLQLRYYITCKQTI